MLGIVWADDAGVVNRLDGRWGVVAWYVRQSICPLTESRDAVIDRIESELLRGAAPLAVLQLLEHREMYGYEMVEALAADSNGALALGQSTLYPLLYNLEAKGLVRAERREATSGRTRKYYRLTAQGRRYLAAGRKRWRALSEEMDRIGLLGPRTKPSTS